MDPAATIDRTASPPPAPGGATAHVQRGAADDWRIERNIEALQVEIAATNDRPEKNGVKKWFDAAPDAVISAYLSNDDIENEKDDTPKAGLPPMPTPPPPTVGLAYVYEDSDDAEIVEEIDGFGGGVCVYESGEAAEMVEEISFGRASTVDELRIAEEGGRRMLEMGDATDVDFEFDTIPDTEVPPPDRDELALTHGCVRKSNTATGAASAKSGTRISAAGGSQRRRRTRGSTMDTDTTKQSEGSNSQGQQIRVKCITWNLDNQRPKKDEVKYCIPKDGVNFDLIVIALQQTKVESAKQHVNLDGAAPLLDDCPVRPSPSLSDSSTIESPLRLSAEGLPEVGDSAPAGGAERCSATVTSAMSTTSMPTPSAYVDMAAKRLGPGWRFCAGETGNDVECVAFCRIGARVQEMDHTHQMNKRCCLIALLYEHTRIAFVSCKFPHRAEFDLYATHDEIREKRNRIFYEMIERSRDELMSESCNTLGILEAVDHSFWMGSFNYDIDMETSQVLAHVEDHHVAPLMGEDEMTKARLGRDAFVDFSEGEIEFMPTAPCTRRRGLEHLPGARPGYLDRILWKSASHCSDDVVQNFYTSVQAVSSSSHKPIVGIFSFPSIERIDDKDATFDNGTDFVVESIRITNGIDLPEKGVQFRIYTNPPNLLHTSPLHDLDDHHDRQKTSKFSHFHLTRKHTRHGGHPLHGGSDTALERNTSHFGFHNGAHATMGTSHHSFRRKGEVLKGHVDGFMSETRSRKDQKKGNIPMDIDRFRRKYGDFLRLKIPNTPEGRKQLRSASLVIGVMSEARVVGVIQVPLVDLGRRGHVDYDTLLPMRYHYARLQHDVDGVALFFEEKDEVAEGIKLRVNLSSATQWTVGREGLHNIRIEETPSWADVKHELVDREKRRSKEGLLDDGRDWLREICAKEEVDATKRESKRAYEKNKWLIRGTILIPIWIIGGTLFYFYICGWSPGQAFYFCVQSGFSVGFGAYGVTCADADNVEACEWYTIVHVLMGSTFIGIALGLWATHLVADSDRQIRERQREMIRKLSGLNKMVPIDEPKSAASRGRGTLGGRESPRRRSTTSAEDLGIAITFAPSVSTIGAPSTGVGSERHKQEAFARELRTTLRDVLPAVSVDEKKGFARADAPPRKPSKLSKLATLGGKLSKWTGTLGRGGTFGRRTLDTLSTAKQGEEAVFELSWVQAEVDLPRSDADEAVLQFQGLHRTHAPASHSCGEVPLTQCFAAHVFVKMPPGLKAWAFDDESLSDILLEQLMHHSVSIQQFRVTDVCPIETVACRGRGGIDYVAVTRWELVKARLVEARNIVFWVVVFFVMTAIGVIYSMTYIQTPPHDAVVIDQNGEAEGKESWSLSKAGLYSITAMSTGGLVAPSTEEQSMWFTGFFCLIGVPIYGAMLGSIGGRLSQEYQEDIKTASLKRFTDHDREALIRSGAQRDLVDWGDFLQIMIVKLGLATQQDVEHIRRRFDKMDLDHSGTLSRDELEVELAFSVADLNEDGRLDYNEFVHLCVNLWCKHEARARKRGDVNRMAFLRKLFEDQVEFDKLWTSAANRGGKALPVGIVGTIGARELKDLLQALSRRAARTQSRSGDSNFSWEEVMSEDSRDADSAPAVAGRATGFEAFVKPSIV